MDEVENKNHLLGASSSNINEMQFRKLLRGTFFNERGSLSSSSWQLSLENVVAALSGAERDSAAAGMQRKQNSAEQANHSRTAFLLST